MLWPFRLDTPLAIAADYMCVQDIPDVIDEDETYAPSDSHPPDSQEISVNGGFHPGRFKIVFQAGPILMRKRWPYSDSKLECHCRCSDDALGNQAEREQLGSVFLGGGWLSHMLACSLKGKLCRCYSIAGVIRSAQ